MASTYQKKSKKKRWIWFLIVLFLSSFFSVFFLKTSFTISRVVGWSNAIQILPSSDNLPPLPEKDLLRINILLLGMRGLDEPGEGKLLSDAIILVSIKKDTGRIAIISIPRDLYLRLWCSQESKKINFAFAHGGLDCAKKTISYLTGLYIDYAVGVNFEALKETVDALGGIEIYLDKPFEEDFQWAKEGLEENENWFIKEIDGEERWVFYIPQGRNHLDGETALYYVRSRYSTNDFDRMQRQQQVLLAIKEKIFSLGFLSNPIKIYNLLDILGNNIRTDMGLKDMHTLIGLVDNLDTKNIKKKIFDTSPEGLLYQTFINEEYVLLPVGDNFDKIQETCQNIFD
jgi:LCP family protein required for cell wall assembly